MATLTPTTPGVSTVVTAANLARGSVSRTTFDWRTKFGGWLMIRIGRQGTTALTNGINIVVRPTHNNDAVIQPGPVFEALSQTAAAASTTISGSDSNSGQAAVNIASITGFAAGDYICLVDASYTPSRLEWCRVSKTSGSVITVDSNLKNSHTTGQADRVNSKSDCWTVWIQGGAVYEIIFDYGDDSAGESVTIEALAETVDSYTSS